MNEIDVRPSQNGRGAFATAAIGLGELVWDWSGCKRYTQDQLPIPYVKDDYLRVGQNLYVGPDDQPSEAGDFINHSCAPNCRILVDLDGNSIKLTAIRPIEPGEEVTYDYSSTMRDDSWSIPCNCGSVSCRGVICEAWSTGDIKDAR